MVTQLLASAFMMVILVKCKHLPCQFDRFHLGWGNTAETFSDINEDILVDPHAVQCVAFLCSFCWPCSGTVAVVFGSAWA